MARSDLKQARPDVDVREARIENKCADDMIAVFSRSVP